MSELVLASTSLSTRLGVEKGHMIDTIKAQCFRALRPDQVTDTQLAAYIQIANNLSLNPLLPGMLYAYPERNGGITPIIGPDGIFSLLSNNSDIEGWSTKHEKIDGEDTCTATIKHKRLGDLTKTVFISEWKVANNPNWVQRPRHMLEIRALKQCARQVIHGIPFDEEERHTAEINVTPENEPKTESEKRPAAPARRGGTKAAAESAASTPTSPAATDSSAPIDVVATPTPESTATPPPVETKTTTVTPPPAEQTQAPAEAPPTPPDIAPGVTITGFHGKNWPVLGRATVTNVKRAKTPAKKGLLIISVNIDEPGAYAGDIVTFEHVKVEDDKVIQTADWLKPGAIIEANFVAKLRPGAGGAPDYTKAPAIYAEQVTEATAESF